MTRCMKMTAPRNRQSGLALVIGLIVLLMLTLIGVTAMRSTTLQIKMAANMANRSTAFQAAEAALSQGEIKISNSSIPTSCQASTGYYETTCTASLSQPRWMGIDWTAGSGYYTYNSANAPSPPTGSPTARLNSVTAKYIIRKLPAGSSGSPSLTIGGNTSGYNHPIYRVTAHAVGPGGQAEVTLQSTYQPF